MKEKAFVALVVLSLLLGGCSGGGETTAPAATLPPVQADNRIIAEGRLEPIHYAEVAFNSSGVVSEVLVEQGQQVKKGAPLVRLGNSESRRAAVSQAQEALLVAQRAFGAAQADALKTLGDAYEAVRKAQIKLDDYDVPSYLEGGTPAEGVEKMYAELETARKTYEPYRYRGVNDKERKEQKKRLDDAWDRFYTAIRWARLEAELRQAQSTLDNAQKEFASAANGSAQDSLAQARYETAQANLLAAQAALGDVELTAPFDGVVAELNVKEGGSINAGQIAVAVADFSGWLVKTTDLTELDVVSIAEGQSAVVTLDAIPDLELQGTVQSIGQSYAERQGDVVYEVTVLLADKNPAMRWGMTASLVFEPVD